MPSRGIAGGGSRDSAPTEHASEHVDRIHSVACTSEDIMQQGVQTLLHCFTA